jgi:hypothetical protein
MIPLRVSHWSAVLLLLGALVLAWSGKLDQVADAYVDASIVDAGIIYGTARGINALVSALQGTELDLWLVSFSVGELLDPVNDLIERFSAVMTVAITSLILQQLLLSIVSATTFTLVLSGLAVAVLVALAVDRQRSYPWLLRCFVLVAFLRFSLSLVVIANLWVDEAFLADSQGVQHQQMREFQGDLEGVDAMVRGDEARMASSGSEDACPWHSAFSDDCKQALAAQFDLLQLKFDVFVDSTLKLLGSLLLKALIIPLLFFYALLQATRMLFRKIL